MKSECILIKNALYTVYTKEMFLTGKEHLTAFMQIRTIFSPVCLYTTSLY